ncbi:hypothetical protein G9A89_012614 [Geosiphon pyriformis]|nr:hypothetical protein G9A89_012614 [Geosiphon pyriformis]
MAIVGPSIVIMKKIVKDSGFGGGFKPVLPRKKRKGDALEENVGDKRRSAKEPSGHSWGSEIDNTTESDSIDMEEKCLVEETSFDYEENSVLTNGDPNQMPKRPGIKTKKALSKLLGKIDFTDYGGMNNILLDSSLELPPTLKNLVNVSVRKSFALNIGLDERAFTSSKFSGIIRATFTSKLGLIKATKKAIDTKILVNANLKKSTGHSDQAVMLKEIPVEPSVKAVHAALSEFGSIKLIKMQLFDQIDHADLVAARWSILIRKDVVHTIIGHCSILFFVETNAHDIWDFIGSVSGKMCVINQHPITYAQARCAIVCFDLAESLNAVMGTTLVLKGVNLQWSCLGFSKCAKCEKTGHTSLDCSVNVDKSRLAAIYSKCSAPIAHFVAFNGMLWAKIASEFLFLLFPVKNGLVNPGSSLEMKPTLSVTFDIEKKFAVLESSLISLAGQISELAKRLNSFVLAVFQPSPGLGDIVMRESLGGTTSSKTAANLDSSASSKFVMCNVKGLNNPAKQDDVIHWHKDKNNLVSIFIELKLREKVCSWIVNKFDGVWVFTSGLESGHLGAGVVVIMNSSLVRHVYRVSEVPGWLLSIKLLFKNKLSVSVLELYASASHAVCFFQTDEINSFIAKAVNKSSFIILDSNFNENDLHKSTSFKRYLDLGLVNFLVRSVITIIHHNIFGVDEHFNTDHQAVFVSIDLGGLLDMYLNSLRKQNNFKGVTSANAVMFSSDFATSAVFLNLDTMWDAVHKIMCLSASGTFKKKWFKGYDEAFTKESSRFYKLELLVSKLIKASYLISSVKFASLHIEKSHVKTTVNRRIESFKSDKEHIIRSVLEQSFYKVVLDHLIVKDELLLEYVFNDAFLGIMCLVIFDKLLVVVFNLPEGKAAGLSGILNELWKHCDKLVLNMLLMLLNSCLIHNLKTFKQIQAESKVASVVSFMNSVGILDRLFSHQSHNLQYLIHIKINSLNNFLAGIMCIFFRSNLSLSGSPSSAFRHYGRTPMSLVLSESNYLRYVSSLWYYRIVFKWLNPYGPVPIWFNFSVQFLGSVSSLSIHSSSSDNCGFLDVFQSHNFGLISDKLLCANVDHLFVYMDRSLSSLGTLDMKTGAAIFFENIGMGLGVEVSGLMFSTMMELQIKNHLGVSGNEHANELAKTVVLSNWHLFHLVNEYYLRAGGATVSSNSRHFVQDVFWSVHYAQ